MNNIISRTTWGAKNRNGVGTRTTGKLEKYLHHAAIGTPSASNTLKQDAAYVRTVERIGQQRFGAGISYTFLVLPSGRVFQGTSVNRVSYHSGAGRNTRGAAICLVGNFEDDKPTAAMVSAVVWLLQEGVRRGWWGDPALTEMHRDFRATACPGKHAASLFDEINRRGRGQSVSSGSNGSSPKPAPAPVPEKSGRTPVAPSRGRWPQAYLTVVPKHNQYTHRAWRDLMKRVGYEARTFTLEMQRWLAQWPKYDVGPDDDDWGPRTTRALQRFLKERGHYAGLIDGDRGPMTIRAEIEYLNAQAEIIVNL